MTIHCQFSDHAFPLVVLTIALQRTKIDFKTPPQLTFVSDDRTKSGVAMQLTVVSDLPQPSPALPVECGRIIPALRQEVTQLRDLHWGLRLRPARHSDNLPHRQPQCILPVASLRPPSYSAATSSSSSTNPTATSNLLQPLTMLQPLTLQPHPL